MTQPQEPGKRASVPLDRNQVPEPGPLRPFHFPPIERFTLSNGLPVLVAQVPGLPVATWNLLLDAGGVHERGQQAGLASLTSSLLESGAGQRNATGIADDLERLGMQLGVGTSWDSTHLSLTGLASKLGDAAGILTELVRHPTFPDAEVERLRHEQQAAILQRRAEPRGLANEMALRFIFSERSPFGRPLTGTPQSLEALSREDVGSFHRERFTPASAALMVAGEMTPEDAHQLAEAHFGDWSGAVAPRVDPVVEPRSEEAQLVVVHRPGAVQSEIRVGHIGVARDHKDYFPLLVMNSILGGAFSSRLNLNLRERHGFTYGVSSGFVMRRLPGPFLVSTAVQTEVTAQALTEILREVHGIREAAVTSAELDSARNYLAGTFPLRLQTTDGVASRLTELALYALPLDYFDSYRERILEVSSEEVLRVARAHLHPERFAMVIVGDADQIREPLEELDLGPVRVVKSVEEA